MQAAEIPAELREILDRRAGKVHSAEGPVMRCLAEILTRHREIVLSEASITSGGSSTTSS
jgi:hypothetical protein